VYWAFCESHARDISFHVVARLLRAGTEIADLDGPAARARVREQLPDADAEDLMLLDDLLGIADANVALPQIDPDARRRRLSALMNTAALARTEPALFIIEDAHWIDAVSESMLADFFTVIPRTPSMVLITSRPEYDGALTRMHGAQSIALAPLGGSDTAALLGELLGADPSVGELAAIIADRAAGNPFFAEEMVRELVQRRVLTGERGGYLCQTDVAELSVPGTVQAAIAARIDGLSTPARRTLNAASVIGDRFEAEQLAALGIDPVVDELQDAELIDQVLVGDHFGHSNVGAVIAIPNTHAREIHTALRVRTGGAGPKPRLRRSRPPPAPRWAPFTELNCQISELEANLRRQFETLGRWTSTSPSQDSVMSPAPGCEESSGTTRGRGCGRPSTAGSLFVRGCG
jgi:hypothetical protein